MPSPNKMRRVGDSTSRRPQKPEPPVLCHLPILREHLFPFLTTSDCIALFWTSTTLHDDDEIARRAFEHMDVRGFFRDGPTDWCAAVPTFPSDNNDDDDHDPHSEEEENDSDESDEVDERGPLQILKTWRLKLRSREPCAALLSLASLMRSELGSLLYAKTEGYGTEEDPNYTIVPFILPLARLDAIAQQQPPPGPATFLGCHIENSTAERDGDDAVCALCEALTSIKKVAKAYEERHSAEEAALEQQLRDQGYASDSEPFHTHMEAYRQRVIADDEIYLNEDFPCNLGPVVVAMCDDGTLPPLQLLREAEPSVLEHAVSGGPTTLNYSEPNYSDDPESFCQRNLRPLVTFFRCHGFGRVHRMQLSAFQKEDDFDPITSVEMVGAAAPHGFFAGVYCVLRE